MKGPKSRHIAILRCAVWVLPMVIPGLGLAGGGQQSTYSVVALDSTASERWPTPVSFAIRRSRTSTAETVAYTLSGTAKADEDYSAPSTRTVSFAVGQAEAWVTLRPIVDQRKENQETIILTLNGLPATATIALEDNSGTPTSMEVNRFLNQAAFGSDEATVKEVQRLGFSDWIDAQFRRPVGLMQPSISRKIAAQIKVSSEDCRRAFWEQATRKLGSSPSTTSLPDPLRQKVAYALSQLFVISTSDGTLGGTPEGVMNFEDQLLTGAFGNFRDLMKKVAMHPAMGVYLSHRGNRKADLKNNRFPDENFARELMQLFSIGLWKLNPDGTQALEGGLPVPTYDNNTIKEYARVFTGVNYGGPENTSFGASRQNFLTPMKMWDAFHDLEPKRLIDGKTTPQRVASPADKGIATNADVDMAIDSLFNHQNVGPFVSRLLIQRLVTSNPSPSYISRVSAVFANNGKKVRGDLAAVVKAILLDPEARDYSFTVGATSGKKREPYLVLVHLVRAFDGRPAAGTFEKLPGLYNYLLQQPYGSPSVFNFYLPTYAPAGPLTEQKKVAPEFQIMTAVTASGALNVQYGLITSGWGSSNSDPAELIKLKLDPYVSSAEFPDQLVQRLAGVLLDRPLKPSTFQIIRNAVNKSSVKTSNWKLDRVKLALYLITTTAEFQIQR